MTVTAVADRLVISVEAHSSQAENIHYQVVHWIPGRFRIRIPRLHEDEEYTIKLKYVLDTIEFVTEVEINAQASSLVVSYKHQPTATAIAIVQEKLFTAIQRASEVEVPLGWTGEKEEKKADNEVDFVERLGFPIAGLVLSVGALAGLPIPGFVIAGVVFIGAMPVFKRAWEAIQQDRQLTIDFLDGLAISLHTLQGHYFAPSFMLGLVEGGEAVRDMTARGSERANLDLMSCLNKTTIVIRDGQEIEIDTKDVVPGDHVLVYPGDQVPVDGIILTGTGILDQCKLTGESVPVTRREGDEVFASTLLVDGNLTILAERTGNNTRAGVIVNLMQAAPVHDTRVENYAATVANQFVLPTLLIAGGVGLASGNMNRAVALLTLDFGTGIRVSVPTTILSVLTYAARNGVLIRSGRAIEILATIDTVVFDKTGTLTIGHAGVNDIDIMDDRFTKDEVLCLAATAEQGLAHPIAEAIVHNARDKGLVLKECEEWEYKVGLGAVAKIDGMQIIVGSPRFMTQENVDLDEYDRHYPDAKSGGQSLVYVAGDGKLIGVIRYSDPPREESKQVIKELKEMGINAYMLSGDVTRVARAIAGNLGMNPDNIYAEAFPERKVEVVKGLHDSGKTVAFCGDGINDSAALAYADVSISFAGATDIARETADVVLMEDDLRGLIMAIKCARQAMDIIWQNTAIVAIPNLGALLSGIFFALDPILAVVINNGTAILAELNGLRPLMGPGDVTPLGHTLSAAEIAEQENRLHQHQPTSTSNQVLPTYDVQVEEVLVSSQLQSEVKDKLANTNRHSNHENGNGNGHGYKENAAITLNGTNGSQVKSQPTTVKAAKPSENKTVQLKQSELAKRLGLSPQALTRHRSRPGFIEWSRIQDPEGVAWVYEPTTKSFHVVDSVIYGAKSPAESLA
ncbi:heavy metal translocating P-type ATPase [Fischerella thermalis CCMEE 5282]|uniref:heavy metal translocating P-type ATPase n=1 Tax=Fischerella thermalis TaxID=372787 RepID=UPI000C806204|nr:heavy metal translocating P-type ATPase [Fischerella thermalis]PMB12144.1 heavy metal translocating P-type ATPase [Fischerella thermalis CCMEE 5282]